MKIKICGLKNAAHIEAATVAGADMAGLVFFEKSPRHVTVDDAVRLRAHMRGRIACVALVVDAPDRALDDIVASVRPDWLQLHGAESPARTALLARRYGLPVIKAIAFDDVKTVQAAIDAYAPCCRMLLVEAPPPPDAARPGGHGRALDWRRLPELAARAPLMLAGGLTPDNVAQAIALSGAYAVDVSSGVEHHAGRKDSALIAGFVHNARKAARGAGPGASTAVPPGHILAGDDLTRIPGKDAP